MQKLFSAVLAIMLVCSLSACGASGSITSGNYDTYQEESSNYPTRQTGDTLFGGDSTDDVADNSGGSDTGTSYAHMLDNGRVRDTDGNLLDNENASW